MYKDFIEVPVPEPKTRKFRISDGGKLNYAVAYNGIIHALFSDPRNARAFIKDTMLVDWKVIDIETGETL